MKFVTAAAILVMPFTLNAEIAEIRLMDTISVEAPIVELGEVATIACSDPMLKERLVKLEIAPTPQGSNPQIISAYKIRSLLEKAQLDTKCQLFGKQTTVSVETRPVTDEEVIRLIKQYLDENLEAGTDLEIDYVKLPPRWKIPVGDSVKISVENKSNRNAGTLAFTLRASINDQVLSSTYARIHASLYKDSFVLAKPVMAGEILTTDHIETVRADVTKANGMEIASIDSVLGFAAKRNLPTGTLLDRSHFDKPVLIKRGSINRIMVVNGPIQLNIAGAEALQNGKEGEIVMFRNPMNNRDPLKARVLGNGLAIIEIR